MSTPKKLLHTSVSSGSGRSARIDFITEATSWQVNSSRFSGLSWFTRNLSSCCLDTLPVLRKIPSWHRSMVVETVSNLFDFNNIYEVNSLSSFWRNCIRTFICLMSSSVRTGVSGLLTFCDAQIDDAFFFGNSQFFFAFVRSVCSGSFLRKRIDKS